MSGFEGWWVDGKTGKGYHISEHWMEIKSNPERFGLTDEIVKNNVGERVLGLASFEVNSVHGQAVNRLGEGLRVEARAPDGVVEAFSALDARGFNLCVQWHPEWQAASNDVSMRMLTAFGQACRQWKEGLRGPHP